jgi:hypothetical protein
MDGLNQIKKKLQSFEAQLKTLLGQSEQDLDIASQLQKLLMPNRAPEIPGLKVFARFIPAGKLSAESFDIIPTKDGREVWFINSWTESFGLSSLLLEVLVHLQSQALIHSRAKMTPDELFNDISIAMTKAKKQGQYRLHVSKLDLSTLAFNGLSRGCGPVLRRASPKLASGAHWEMVQPEALIQTPQHLSPAVSAAPTLAEEAYHFAVTLSPGTRFFILSSEWNGDAKGLAEFCAPLKLEAAPKAGGEVLDDMNHLLLQAQNSLKARHEDCDLSLIGAEIDSKRLHLA